jgi:Spy/CpxP family protein refolding chaperone
MSRRDDEKEPDMTSEKKTSRRLAGLAALVALAALAMGAVALWAHGPSQGSGPGFGHRRALGFGAHHGFAAERTADPAQAARHLEFMVRWALDEVDATEAQTQQVTAILQQALTELAPLRDEHRSRHEAMRTAMIDLDRDKVEALRKDAMQSADQASRKLTQALLDAGAVLNPEQRARLADAAQRHFGHFGRFAG